MNLRKEYIMGSGIDTWRGGKSQTIEFIVTQDCNLRCGYCYEYNKNNKHKMSFEVAKRAIDYLIDNPDLFNSDALVLEFIGGEPLLEIDLISKITDYFKIRTFELNHKWFKLFRISMTTNGILYDTPKVQKFIAENYNNCSICITIDGNKDKHDAQRVYPNGVGSYDDVVKNIPLWLSQFPYASTKVTIGHEDLKYVKDSIVHLWNLGIKKVPANVVYEDVWKENDPEIFEEQLMELADYVIDNKLWNEYTTTLFTDSIGVPNNEESLRKNWCGSGKMLAVDADGNFFPCLRYMNYSLKNFNQYVIGNVFDGVNFDKVRPFLALNTEVQSDKECLECEVASGCAWCQGNNYDSSGIGTNYTRVKHICEMHKARCRANNYYWDKLKKLEDINREQYLGLTKQIYFITSDDCVEYCNYNSKNSDVEIMDEETLEAGIKFAHRNFFTPVILHSKNSEILKKFNTALDKKFISRTEIYSSDDVLEHKNSNRIQIVTMDQLNNDLESENCILKVKSTEISRLHSAIEYLLKKVDRINLNVTEIDEEFDYEVYKFQLEKASDLICEYYKSGNAKEVSVITDKLYLNKMDNCNAGYKSFALAPNGKFYICPAFYFKDKNESVGSLSTGIDVEKYRNEFTLDKAPICKKCDAFQCDRCIYLNKNLTTEYNIPSTVQCKKSHIEREITSTLYSKLKEVNVYNIIQPKEISYNDPLEIALDPSMENPYNIFNS